MYRHHVEPRGQLYVPKEESFPIPLKYIDVSRTTHTNLDVMQDCHSEKLTLSGEQTLHWNSRWKAEMMIIGTLMATESF